LKNNADKQINETKCRRCKIYGGDENKCWFKSKKTLLKQEKLELYQNKEHGEVKCKLTEVNTILNTL